MILTLLISLVQAAEQEVPITGQIANLYTWALGVGGLVALGALIYGGILYTISAGNESRIGDAKEWVIGALVGLLILFSSYLILNTINPNLTKLSNINILVNKPAEPVETSGGAIFVPPNSIAVLPVGSTEELRKQINPGIFAHSNDATAVATGCAPRRTGPNECVPIDPKIWQLIVYLQNRGFDIRISSMVGTHSQLTTGGNVSRHWDGHAIDINTVNGKPVSSPSAKADTIALMAALLDLRGTNLVPSQAISNGNGRFDSEVQRYQINGGQQVSYVDAGHTDHIHIGY